MTATLNDTIYQVYSEKIEQYGETGGCMFWFIDMTENYRYTQELEVANEAKSNFLARTSHEIRTPIHAILGMNEMIMRECEDVNIMSYSQDIDEMGETLLALINDILDISQIEKNKIELLPLEYNVKDMLSDIWLMTSFRANNKKIKLSMNVDPSIPLLLYGDEIRIKQILLNLLTNAVKYTEQGEVTLTVSVENMDDENQIMLRYDVSDTGCGIKEGEQDSIFDMFERSENDKLIEGNGLGLAIVKRLIGMMEGTIEVKSVYGTGSTFTIKIPQGICGEMLIGNMDNPTQLHSDKARSEALFEAPDVSILLVDDNEMNRKVIAKLLERTKVQLIQTNSGESCLTLCEKQTFDIILMDQMMPGLSGTETMQQLREHSMLNRLTPVIVLTADAIVGMKEKYLGMGFDAYLSKPVKGSELEKVIYQVLHGAQHYFVNLTKHGIDVTHAIEYSDDSKEFYLELIQGFLSDYATQKAELEDAIAKEDIKSMTVKAHALKNNARSLGATQLSGVAYQLERMGKEEQWESVDDIMNQLSREWQHTIEVFQTNITISL